MLPEPPALHLPQPVVDDLIDLAILLAEIEADDEAEDSPTSCAPAAR